MYVDPELASQASAATLKQLPLLILDINSKYYLYASELLGNDITKKQHFLQSTVLQPNGHCI